MASGQRVHRVRVQLLRELSDILQRLRDPRLGFVTVMDVRVSKDLSYATMYVSVLGGEEAQQQAMDALVSALGYIRRELAQRLTIRHVPEIAVEYDDTSERAARVSSLIDRLPPDGGEGLSPSEMESSAGA